MIKTNTSITLSELIDEINKSFGDEYSFLKLLDKNDKAIFVSRIPEKYYDEIYIRKKNQIKFMVKYCR